MNKRNFLIIGLASALGLFTGTGCALLRGEMDQGDVALIALDLQDIGREGVIYALAKEPQWKANIVVVRDQLNALAMAPDQPTFDAFLGVVQRLPFDELQTPEARLIITSAKMILRRVGKNVDLGNITNIRPLVQGLANGIDEGLNTPIMAFWSPVPQPSDVLLTLKY